MKKLLKICSCLSLALIMAFGLAACGEVAEVDGGTKVHAVTVTSWYSDDTYLDTSVNINFDEVKIADVTKVEFIAYVDGKVVGNAVSEGKNLVTLLKDCAQYWEQTAATYLETTGDRTMSCAFKTRTAEEDNGYWVRSACTLSAPTLPTQLKVIVTVDKTPYVSYLKAV